MNVEQNMALFREMIQCAAPVYTWVYDAQGQLLSSNCPDETVLMQAFSAFGCKTVLREYAAENTAPVLLTSPVGLVWAAALEKSAAGELLHAWVIGPIFTTDVSMRDVERALNHCRDLDLSVAWTIHFTEAIQRLPLFQIGIFRHYALMLHYCVTGEKLDTSAIAYPKTELQITDEGNLAPRDRHNVWQTEQGLLRTVREGDINYKNILNQSSNVSSGVPVLSKDSLRQVKTSVIVFTSLCTRAAIEGGLSPDQAYSLGDSYIQQAEDGTDIGEVAAISNAMYDDFIRRVHRCRTNPNVSRQIQECCNYIEMHVEDDLEIETLARRVGYAEYYLTKKFKEEMHVSLNNYIKFVRIERAKLLLTTTGLSVQEIADRLGFCSRSYMGKTFREVAGCSPMDYRRGHRRG